MTKLCARGKAAAKRKFKVYPSAYANAYASKICAGKIKDPSGVKRKDFKGPKPSGKKDGGMIAGSGSDVETLQKIRKLKEESSKIIKDIYSKPKPKKKYERLPQSRDKMQPSKSMLVDYSKKVTKKVKNSKGGYIGSYIKSDLAGEPVSNKSYESYYKDLL